MMPPSLERNPALDTWLRIDAAGTVTVFTGKVELGQGIKTALARIAADELDVALARVRVHTADTAEGPNELLTVGSNSLEESGTALRIAAAEARAHLLELAAAELGAPVAQLAVDDGTVRAPGVARTTSYFALLGGKRFERRITGDARPKRPDEYRILGRPGARIGMEDIVTGRTVYVQDLRLPGMLHARVLRPPSPTAELVALDDGEVRGMPGVEAVVRDGSFVAVVAARAGQAMAALERLRRAARWAEAERLPEQAQLFAELRAAAPQSFPVIDGTAVDAPVPPIATPPDAAHTLRASYTRPFVMHGSIGPSAALAHEVDGRLTVWTASQGVSPLRISLAQALGIDAERVRVIHVEGPGCYGHNGADDAALDAALLARALPGRPVHVQWTRGDEHAWEPYGPATVVDLQASLDASGAVIDWNHDVRSFAHVSRAFAQGPTTSGLLAAWHRAAPMSRPTPRPVLAYHFGIHRNADPLYAFPRRRVVKHFLAGSPFRTSSLRALGAYANVFAIESFVDELAVAAGEDPLAFRLRQLADPRARDVLTAAAERLGWRTAPRPARSGVGRGLGFARYKNQKSWCAVAVELTVDDATAEVRLARAVIAGDAGQIVDPEGIANQLEGGFVQAASWTLHEQVTFDRTRVTSTDWQSYPILGFAEVPEVETVLLDRPGQPWLGAGEASQGPTAAAIANAIFDATGLRVRDLPLTADRLRSAALV
ncbi:MAG: xanthine dehydrogenase family protein molybdopterin-binding subunit [Deltaproteobacteria bacterium]|nr:MAG: xanthine dehydrogenase family protein molybdopterin-binding subunit [Deltaproteobacteria bacterium]